MSFDKYKKAAPAEEEDTWDDEEPVNSGPKIICVARVIKDHIPETNNLLTLILDDLVYVFKQNPDGIWEGETKGVYGRFPKEYVEVVKG